MLDFDRRAIIVYGIRNGSDEGGDGKADADVGVIVGSRQRCGKGRGKTSCVTIEDGSGLTRE